MMGSLPSVPWLEHATCSTGSLPDVPWLEPCAGWAACPMCHGLNNVQDGQLAQCAVVEDGQLASYAALQHDQRGRLKSGSLSLMLRREVMSAA